MAEGHTIHRLAREHNRVLAGRPVRLSSPQGRFSEGAARLDGRRLDRVDPHGKHLFYDFAGEACLHVHLGLYGSLVTAPLPAPAPRGAVRLRLEGEQAYADLRAPPICELIDPRQKQAIVDRLGPDPLRRDAKPERAWSRIRRSPTPIGVALMDQSVLAGVGNVYRAEVLFRQALAPHRPGREVAPAEWDALWEDIAGLLRAGVRTGRIVTTRRQHRSRRTGEPGTDDAFYVYRRTDLPCRICGTAVQAQQLAARTVYWCPSCQPA